MTRNYIPNVVESAGIPNSQFNVVRRLLNNKKHKDGLSNKEISIITGISTRRVREQTQRLKMNYGLQEKTCSCGRTPVLFFL